MYDYEIRDVMRRGDSPQINLIFRRVVGPMLLSAPLQHPKQSPKTESFIEVIAENTGNIYAEYLTGQVKLPLFGLHAGKYEIRRINNLNGTTYQPILPGTKERIAQLKVNFRLDKPNELKLDWEIFADNAGKKVGSVFLKNTVLESRPDYLE